MIIYLSAAIEVSQPVISETLHHSTIYGSDNSSTFNTFMVHDCYVIGISYSQPLQFPVWFKRMFFSRTYNFNLKTFEVCLYLLRRGSLRGGLCFSGTAWSHKQLKVVQYNHSLVSCPLSCSSGPGSWTKGHHCGGNEGGEVLSIHFFIPGLNR